MAKKKRRKKDSWQQQFTYEVIGLLLLTLVVIGIAKLGPIGRGISYFAQFLVGKWHAVFLFSLIGFAFYLIWKRSLPPFWTRKLTGIYLGSFSVLLFTHINLFKLLSTDEVWQDHSVIRNTWHLIHLKVLGDAPETNIGGGMIGAIGFAFFYLLFDEGGTLVISFVLVLIALLLLTGKSPVNFLLLGIKKIVTFILNACKEMWSDLLAWRQTLHEKSEKQVSKNDRHADPSEQKEAEEVWEEYDVETEQIEPVIEEFTNRLPNDYSGTSDATETTPEEIEDQDESQSTEEESFPMAEIENDAYELPSFDLLDRPNKVNQSRDRNQITENIKKLEQTFESFGVKAKVLKVHLGPAVTKYEVHPAVGVKVSRIVSLSDDLALALAAKDIRIEAPIPGKSAIGIEVPNFEVSVVALREVLETAKYKQHQSKLAIALGRDISGEPLIADLRTMPHLLVAGATGSGKSVCINGIITSLLMRAKPHEVRLMMIDPKMVELNVYNGVPHLLTPVVNDPKKAAQALKKIVDEMERRYEFFAETGTRNIEGYNDWIRRNKGEEQTLLPYIVVIVDELADLMMVASRDVEDAITRLAQMARAAGIHLIIATQRPSVDVITGIIKANIPSRIAFSVSSQVDSRTILDMAGAEKLLGRGDMLFLPVGASKPTRIQGAFLTDHEVEKLVQHTVSQQKAVYREDLIPKEADPDKVEIDDELYDDAVQLVIERQTASVSMLQRRFRIGYTRAARLIDAMEDHGIVGPYEGSRPRTVLITDQEEASGS